MTGNGVWSPGPRLIWTVALIMSLVGWGLIAARLALFVFGHPAHPFDWRSLMFVVPVLVITTALSLGNRRRIR